MTEELPKIGDVVADKYCIEDVIGEGGMGVVFTATHRITGKRVALKWMHQELAQNEEAVQRFIREAQAAGRIDHPNVVDIYDVEHHGNTVFLVMEYLYGEPLTDYLARDCRDIAEVIRMLLPALRGVAAAHKRGIVHRDIKPDNIFLCRSPDGKPREAKVLDFGISKVISNEQQYDPRLTRTGALMGTPYYMSPEQVRGSKDIGPQTDIYAFGIILYEALTGEVPFYADSFTALVLEIATGTPRPASEVRTDLPIELDKVIAKAMAREPSNRYPDIESLARALEPFAGGAKFDSLIPASSSGHRRESVDQPVTATATPFTSELTMTQTPAQRPTRKGFSKAMVGSGLTLAVLVVAGFAVWKYINSSERQNDAARPDASPSAATIPQGESKPISQSFVEPERVEQRERLVEQDTEKTTSSNTPTAAKRTEQTADAGRSDDSEKIPQPVVEKRTSAKSVRKIRRTHPRTTTRPRATARRDKALPLPPKTTAPPEPAPAPAAPSTGTVRGRTGGLTIDEF